MTTKRKFIRWSAKLLTLSIVLNGSNPNPEIEGSHHQEEFRGLIDQTLSGIFYQLNDGDEDGTRIPLEAFREWDIPPEFCTQVKIRKDENVTVATVNNVVYVKTVFRPWGRTSETKIYRHLDNGGRFTEIYRE